MKYYGIKWKQQRENIEYLYALTITKLKSVIPWKHQKIYKRNYEFVFKKDHTFKGRYNGIPDKHFLKLEQIVTSDLIYREDINKLQKGIRELLKSHRAGDRFLVHGAEGLEEICKKIDQMDSSLLMWYNRCECGVFDFRGDQLEQIIDHFTMEVKNINSSYLNLEFQIFLSNEKAKELERLINEDYHHHRGQAYKVLTSPKNGGAISTYSVVHYNDEFLKADRISDFLGCIEWEFYNALSKYFPLMLHDKGLIPPRIEVFFTDIDYHDGFERFWDSIGINHWHGQFIDERQKMFFDHKEAKDENWPCPRLLYINKDDGIEAGHLESVKDQVYDHLQDVSQEYFKFLFLGILSHEAGRKIVEYKHHLDKIKLKKNRLHKLLKLRYSFERNIDSYVRFVRDDIWDTSIKKIKEAYICSDSIIKVARRPFFRSYKSFCEDALHGAESINEAIESLRNEFESKRIILQHLADYKNSTHNMWLNVLMLIVATLTLFFVIYPKRAGWTADIITSTFTKAIEWLMTLPFV